MFVSLESELTVIDGTVSIEAIANDGDGNALLRALEDLGLRDGVSHQALASGWLPVDQIIELAELDQMSAVLPNLATNNVGLTESQAVIAHQIDEVFAETGLDGTGVKIGILSDSFATDPTAATTFEDDVASGDLPEDVTILRDFPVGADEGRAMAQLIHDIAPGAELMYHTAFGGQSVFAEGIRALADAGADIIVDDILYLGSPMFMDGIVAQAVDDVVADGVAYFSSAGNQANRSYEAPLRPVPVDESLSLPFSYQSLHDFDPGDGVDVTLDVGLFPGGRLFLDFQWPDPNKAFAINQAGPFPQTDLDIFLLDQDGTIVAQSVLDNISQGVAFEIIDFTNQTGVFQEYQIVIGNFAGPDPDLIKFVDFTGNGFFEYPLDGGTVYGQNSARGAMAVAASDYRDTPEFGLEPPFPESFTSDGGDTPIVFTALGEKLETADIRERVDITAVDGVNNTFFGSDSDFDGFPNFFGTSAAAPNAAAIAALLKQAEPDARPIEIYEALEQTAIDMDNTNTAAFDVGYDTLTGFGLVDGLAALEAIMSDQPSLLRSVEIAELIERHPVDPTIINGFGDVVLEGQADSLITVSEFGGISAKQNSLLWFRIDDGAPTDLKLLFADTGSDPDEAALSDEPTTSEEPETVPLSGLADEQEFGFLLVSAEDGDDAFMEELALGDDAGEFRLIDRQSGEAPDLAGDEGFNPDLLSLIAERADGTRVEFEQDLILAGNFTGGERQIITSIGPGGELIMAIEDRTARSDSDFNDAIYQISGLELDSMVADQVVA